MYANHLVTTTCVQKSYEIKKKIPNLFPLGKMLLLMARKDPQEELNLDSKLREFFSSTHQICAWLTNQSISPGFCQFGQFNTQSAE
jgi:hypothetical protein